MLLGDLLKSFMYVYGQDQAKMAVKGHSLFWRVLALSCPYPPRPPPSFPLFLPLFSLALLSLFIPLFSLSLHSFLLSLRLCNPNVALLQSLISLTPPSWNSQKISLRWQLLNICCIQQSNQINKRCCSLKHGQSNCTNIYLRAETETQTCRINTHPSIWLTLASSLRHSHKEHTKSLH